MIVAYYNPPDIDLSEEIFKILSNSNKDVILLGDLNAKSTASGGTSYNKNGEILDNVLFNHNLICINDREHTYYNFNGKSSDILDYCICSPSLFKNLESFKVLENHDMKSDHMPLLVSFLENNDDDSYNNFQIWIFLNRYYLLIYHQILKRMLKN